MEAATSKNDGSSGNGNNKIKKCVGKDSLERMNYLYQACNAVITEDESSHSASQMYSNLLVTVSKKAVQKLDINMKRTVCKGCRCLLLAGLTCKVRIKKKRAVWTCLTCHTVKEFNLKNKDYVPWPLRDESIVEILDYKQNE